MTISKKNNKYYCKFQINGKEYHRLCKNCNKLSEAKEFELRLKEIIENDIEQNSISFSYLMRCYLSYSRLNKKSYETDLYRSKIILQFFDKFKDIVKIKRIHIEQFKESIMEGRSKTTVNRYLQILSKMFNIAIENEWLNKNPVSKNIKFKEKNYKVRFLTTDEQERLFQYLEGDIKEIVIVALNTGLRLSNILKLEWNNIDLNARIIELTENKTDKHLKIYMNDELFNLLSNKHKTNKYVFYNPKTNKPYDKKLRRFRTALKRAGIENFRFHDLRHTVATRLANSNTPLNVVKEILGHSNIQTTMRYVHTTSQEIKNAMDILH